MLTKGDLTAIQRMFDLSKNETNERFDRMDKRFESIDERFESIDERLDHMDKKIDNLADTVKNLSNSLRKNTEDLIELITAGFKASNYDSRLQGQDNILDNHEKRISHLEYAEH